MDIYWPDRNFVTVSLTGENCALQCPHCEARYLRHMEPAMTPEELYRLAEASANAGKKGMLISGGCDSTGQVPIFNYLDIIKNIKENIDISINIHTGFIRLENIPLLAGKGIDVISFDVIGSPEVVKKIYGLDLEPGYFGKAFSAFKEAGLRLVPHVTAGLDAGKDSGERAALEIIARHDVDFVVINALMSREYDSSERLTEVLRLAREVLPSRVAIGIGCMRPRNAGPDPGQMKELGIASVAMPSKGLVAELKKRGVEILEKEGCCAFYLYPKSLFL